jgi:immune inhibitor A
VTFDGNILGPYMLPRNLTDYAHGGSGSSNPYTKKRDAEPNAQTMANDALALAQADANFSLYDNDSDGYVDGYVVVHAGSGAEKDGDGNKIWSVKWVLPKVAPVNGVNVWTFLTVPEDAELGVCVHELGHLVFQWPDLYDSDRSSAGIGNWCVMASSSWGGSPAGSKPCHPSAWCKASKTAKWVDVVVEEADGPITIAEVKTKDTGKIHRLWTNGDRQNNEYYLLENRQRNNYDESLPSEGLLSKSLVITSFLLSLLHMELRIWSRYILQSAAMKCKKLLAPLLIFVHVTHSLACG